MGWKRSSDAARVRSAGRQQRRSDESEGHVRGERVHLEAGGRRLVVDGNVTVVVVIVLGFVAMAWILKG